jgi:cytochrome P450
MDFAPDRPEFYLSNPHQAFRRLRAEDPVHWYEEGGFWCVTRYAHLQQVSRDPRTYTSEQGTQLFQIAQHRNTAAAAYPDAMRAPSIIQMDPPRHNRHRKLVIGSFTPRRIATLEPMVRDIARKSFERVPLGEEIDFIEHVAVPLPMLVIAEILGVPPDRLHDFRRWSDALIEAGGGGLGPENVGTIAEFFAFLGDHVQSLRRAPKEDVLSQLLNATVDGDRLEDAEIVMFALTLLVAGNETTRNLIAGGTLALLDREEQWDRLMRDPSAIPNAVEEMLRWVTPVRTFVRRAIRDSELGGKTITAGEYVLLLYGSANRDEAVFGSDAEEFDITRASARRHVAFGFGEHLCLGASLARLEARVVFEELFARLPRFELAGEVEPLPSVLMNGIVRMPVVFAT